MKASVEVFTHPVAQVCQLIGLVQNSELLHADGFYFQNVFQTRLPLTATDSNCDCGLILNTNRMHSCQVEGIDVVVSAAKLSFIYFCLV